MNKNSIRHLILEVKTKPSLYLSDVSIISLASFITGWITRDVNTVIDLEVMHQFENWLKHKYNVSEGTQGWCSVIMFHSVNEHAALSRFFELFDEFIASPSNSLD